MRRLLAILLMVGAGQAKPATWPDEMHPRSPQTPLEIVFRPYYCSRCLDEGILEGEKKKVTMLRLDAAELAKHLEMEDWLVMETPHYKILTDFRKSKVKWKDSVFLRADFERLRQIFPKLKPGREGALLDAHQRAHLYHIRIERVYNHFAALVDNDKPHLGMMAKYEVYLFDDYAQHHALCDGRLGRTQDKAGVQWHVRELPNFMMVSVCESQVVKNDGKGDKILSNHIIHNVAHILADGHYNYHRETWAWLEEGIAHYYERRENPKHNSFCWAEGKRPTDFLKPDWESTLFNIVRRGKDTNFNQWCEKLIPGELTGVEQGMCWSFVKWMIETEPIRFTKMYRKLADYEEKPNCAQCIEHAFGASPSVMHQRWREYVLQEYRKK